MSTKSSITTIGSLLRRSMTATSLLLASLATADEYYEYNAYLIACDTNHCLVTYQAKDSDSDGVSDQDELAADTNPDDATSRPPILQLTEMAVNLKLPSAWDGMTEILVLPTKAPDGKDLFGGNAAMPTREDTLSRLGISAGMMAELGIDPSGGVRITLDHPKNNTSLGGVPARVAGLPMAEISAGFTPLPPLLGSSSGKKVDWSQSSSSYDGDTRMGKVTIAYDDHSIEIFSTMVGNGSATTDVTNYDASGNSTGGMSETATVEHHADGSYTTRESSNTRDGSGNITSSSFSSRTTHADGTVDYSSSSTKTTYDDKGNQTGSTNVTENSTCTDSGCSGERVTTTCGSDQSSCTSKTETTKPDEDYVDPSYSPVVVDAAMVQQVLATQGSTVKTVQNFEPPVGDPTVWQDARPGSPMVILVDPDQAYPGVVAIGEIDFNHAGGNVDYDPNLPAPPTTIP